MFLLHQRAPRGLRARFFDAEFARFDGVPAFADRPYEYFPRATDPPTKIALEKEMAEKYYKEYGVTAACKPVTNLGTWDER